MKGGSRVKQDNALGKNRAGQGLLLLDPPSVPTVLGTNENGSVDEDTELLLDEQVSFVQIELALTVDVYEMN